MVVGDVPFGKYTLVRKIATGGMAEIFLAKQPGLEGFERFIVIKRILPHLTENAEFVQMFVDEMRIAALLSHPNIVQIHDIGAVDGQYFIAMEYLEGRDLRKIMRKAAGRGQVVPLGFALAAMIGVCDGLGYAHQRRDNEGRPLNIIHRDVSPQNVVCTVQGAIKLLDFGIAKAESQFYETRSGVLKGKYSYMSPEQASGRPLDHRSDLFPLGTMLYELTTGRRLFKHDNDIVVLKMVAEADVPAPRLIDPGYPEELERIVLKTLARRPADRYQSCRELREDLERFGRTRGSLLSPSEAGDYVTDLLSDEASLLDPTAMAPAPAEGFVSFLESSDPDSVMRTPSFPSLLERSVAPQQEVSGTGSLSLLFQRAKRRPALTVGLASFLVLLLVAGITVVALGGGSAGPDRAAGPGQLDAGEWSTVSGEGAPNDLVNFGTIAVETTPPNARVFFDGEEMEGTTPLSVPAVVVGEEHFVVVELEGHTSQARRVRLDTDGDFKTLRFDFLGADRPARISLDGLPDNAIVEIDGQRRSPGNLSVEAGVPHVVVVTLGGLELLREEVIVGSGEETRLEVRSAVVTKAPSGLDRDRGGEEERGSGVLSVSSSPSTTVYLGNRALGQTPVRTEVRAGSYVLKLVNRALLINYSERVRVRPGQRLDRSIEIPQGTLRVSARPWADVSINGVSQGRTPLLKRLYAGSYTVVLSNPEMDRRERQTVRIGPGSDERVRVDWR